VNALKNAKIKRRDNMNIVKNDIQFYPTPLAFGEKILSEIQWDMIETVLEPSAGKGDLVEAILRKKETSSYSSRNNKSFSIDAIEIDSYLREIIKYEYEKGGKTKELDERNAALEKASRTRVLTDLEKHEKQRIEQVRRVYQRPVRVVHDDFLSFRSLKKYDLVVMNPPFANGELHLLKALEIQKNGGEIVCILNAETILNPYTETRKLLSRLLAKYEAKTEFYHGEEAFSDGERPTQIQVAVVKISIPRNAGESDIFTNMQKAMDEDLDEDPELHELVGGDDIERAVHFFNVEVAATSKLIREYYSMVPHMYREFPSPDAAKQSFHDKEPILILTTKGGSAYSSVNINEYIEMVRGKYWKALFSNEKFIGRLTSKLRQRFCEKIDDMAQYDFSIFNIKQMMNEINSEMIRSTKDQILNLFDELTAQHSWYPECDGNIHYFDGWKTNKAHMIGKKAIIPVNGMFSSYTWSKESFCVHQAFSILSDIEKTLNYLDGNRTADVDLMRILTVAERVGQTRNIECKYFSVDLYKKGTTHIKFHCPDLIERFNIYAAQSRSWLPPNYGKVKYHDMTTEEKAVVDSFQGEKKYGEILAKSGYFLADPCKASTLLAISA